MTQDQAPRTGAPTTDMQAPRAHQMEAQQPRETPQPRTPAYRAAFGDGSGSAWVFRDLASI